MKRLASLRARLLVGVVALATVILVAIGAVTYASQSRFLNDRVDDQAAAAVQAVDRELSGRGGGGGHGPFSGGPPPGEGYHHKGGPAGGQDLPAGTYGELRDPSGTTVDSTTLTYGNEDSRLSPPDLPDEVTPGELDTVSSEDGSLRYRVLADLERNGSTVIAAVPLASVDAQLDRLLFLEAGLIAVGLVLMGLLGWWVVRVGLRPLDRMGATAEAIADGDLSARVDDARPDTEVGRLGMSLNTMLHRIEAAFAERKASEDRLRTFLSDASHELRTPLTSIRGYAELHRMGATPSGPDTTRAMSRIEDEAARMGVLVEDLLTLARLDEVRDAVREPVDVAALVDNAATDARVLAPERKITVRAPDVPARVLGDPHQLQQVFGNLVGNALAHTPAGTALELTVSKTDDRVRATVRDHGPGLPVDDGDTLFERFWRADPARGRGPAGAGLGLAIVHGIVAAHGGEAHAANAPGGGAVFSIELPALDDARPALQKKGSDPIHA